MDCVLCGQTTPAKDRFRLREKRGTPTHLGSLIVSLLEADLWEDTDCSVCRTCRRALLRLEKLKADYDALKGDLKAKVRRGSRQVRLHSRSPTGTTPAAKRAAAARCRSVQTAAKELFPTGHNAIFHTSGLTTASYEYWRLDFGRLKAHWSVQKIN